jgi:hypothetical protein
LPAAAIVAVIGAAVLLTVAAVAPVERGTAARLAGPVTALVAAFVLVAVLAVPTAESFALVRARAADGGALGGAMSARTVASLSAYLTRHRDHRRYEFASLQAALAGPLIVADDQAVLILGGWPVHPLVSARGLSQAVRAGEVRYVLLSARGSAHPLHRRATKARSSREAIIAWVRGHGVDVSHQAGLHRYGILYRVSAPTVGARQLTPRRNGTATVRRAAAGSAVGTG